MRGPAGVGTAARRPTYAVPIAALTAQLLPAGAESGADEDVGVRLPAISSRPILDPTVPFDAHSCAGTAFDVIAGEETGAAAAFRPDDPDLADYAILEFAAFEWHEEDEPVVSHPHDPFGRIDVLRSSPTFASRWTDGCLPNRRGRCCCPRPCCRCGSICPART